MGLGCLAVIIAAAVGLGAQALWPAAGTPVFWTVFLGILGATLVIPWVRRPRRPVEQDETPTD